MKTLFPELEPYSEHFLNAGKLHQIYVEQCGNPMGIPVIFLHGGPGSGCKPYHRRFFDPDVYRIILFDQRGCGRSQPTGELNENSTDDLLQDMEMIRETLNIKKWLLFGGSWGGALALLYAQSYPDFVTGIILRGTFLARETDLKWFAGSGAHRIYPEQWSEFLEVIGEETKKDEIIDAYQALLHGQDEIARRRAARAWENWGATVALGSQARDAQEQHVSASLVHQVKLELHYAKNRYFISENQILEDLCKLPDVPVRIIHGRRDLVCPVESAHTLSKHLPHAEFRVLENAGHIAGGDEMVDALVTATEDFKNRI